MITSAEVYMSIKSIVDAVKSGSLSQKAALQQLGPYMKTHPKQAEEAVSQVLGMPSEPDEVPESVRNTLQIRDSQ